MSTRDDGLVDNKMIEVNFTPSIGGRSLKDANLDKNYSFFFRTDKD